MRQRDLDRIQRWPLLRARIRDEFRAVIEARRQRRAVEAQAARRRDLFISQGGLDA